MITSLRLALAVVLFSAVPASAQLIDPPPTITTTSSFALPFALAVSHPCQTGIVALSGTINVSLTTIKSTDFTFQLGVSATGEGREAGADGLPLANGSLPYAYAAETSASAEFPGGTPLFFAHPITVAAEMIRSDTDAFTLTAVLDLEYNLGVPTTPSLHSIDVSCK